MGGPSHQEASLNVSHKDGTIARDVYLDVSASHTALWLTSLDTLGTLGGCI